VSCLVAASLMQGSRLRGDLMQMDTGNATSLLSFFVDQSAQLQSDAIATQLSTPRMESLLQDFGLTAVSGPVVGRVPGESAGTTCCCVEYCCRGSESRFVACSQTVATARASLARNLVSVAAVAALRLAACTTAPSLESRAQRL
jgi:hypothetical protein